MGSSCSSEVSPFCKAKLLHEYTMFYDITRDGSLDWNDFDQARQHICKIREWSPSSKEYVEMQDVFIQIWRTLQKKADQDEDQKISKEEWLSMWSDYHSKQKSENKEAKHQSRPAELILPPWLDKYIECKFSLYDKQDDGLIDEDEFATMIGKFGLSEEEAREAYKKFSDNNQKPVDLPYFKELCHEYYFSDDPKKLGNFINGKLKFEVKPDSK